jgi:putative tricarboxylic transport membrane protein
MMNGLIPGPFLFRDHGDVAWGVIASLYIGNVILVILNLPFIPLWVAVLRVPYAILYTIILGFCVLGAYSLNGSVFDVGVMTAFGALGYVLRKLDIPAAPMVLTMVLGPLMERALRQSLDISGGDLTILVTRPISAAALAVAALFAATSLLQVARAVKGREAQV